GRPAPRARSGLRADRHRPGAEHRGAARQGIGAAQLGMSASILPLSLTEVASASGGQPIIAGVSLTIEAGPRTIILGANGAGKSVLMRLMHGLLQPSAGTIAWHGENPSRRQAMVFQRPVMLRRSALANLEYGLKVAGVPSV